MFATAGTADVEWFLHSGRRAHEVIQEATMRLGLERQAERRALDFGCGCGRVLRHWVDRSPSDLHGCDVDPRSVRWVARHLHHVTAFQNRATPPLPVADHSYGMVYAFSVLTHLPEPMVHAWRRELARVLEPDGVLMFSTHGDAYLDALTPEEARRYRDGAPVIRHVDEVGDNACGAYHPPSWIRHAFSTQFEIIEHAPRGAMGNPDQDLWTLRRRDNRH